MMDLPYALTCECQPARDVSPRRVAPMPAMSLPLRLLCVATLAVLTGGQVSGRAQTISGGDLPLPHLGPREEPLFEPAPPPQWPVESAPEPSGFMATAAGYAGWNHDECQEYHWQLFPQGLIYRAYLAGAKESRFRSEWNHDSGLGNMWDITLGGNVGLLRYGNVGSARPEGWQLGIEGAGLVRLNIDEERDVDGADFRFGIPITWGDSIHQVKFAYYHLSSHVGDEFLERNPGFQRLNYSRDVLVLGHSLYPADNWRVYAEIGYAVVYDVSEPWEMQFGVEWAPAAHTGARGAPFAAFNGHLRDEVRFGGNFVVQAGWAWRQSPASGLFRVGGTHYNGKDDQFSFFNQSLQKTGFGIWYDY